MESTVVTGGASTDRRRAIPATEVKAKLYGVRGSGPSASTELMLQHKRIAYRRRNLIAIRHRKALLRKGFPGITVPALVLNGRLVQTNRAIARALDELVPDPPLFPAQPDLRAEVEEAERYGDEVLQPATRRLLLWSLGSDPRSVRFHPANGRMYVPRTAWLRARVMPKVFEKYGVTEEVIERDFERLPSMLDRLDNYLAQGVLDSPLLNAADFEIAPLIGALMGLGDLADEVGRRPLAALPNRVLPRP
jgi:glutathione S-transferase